MKPRIYRPYPGCWVLKCKRRLREFMMFGASKEERDMQSMLPLSFKSWDEAVNMLKALYRAGNVIR